MKIVGEDYEIDLEKKPRENAIIIEGFPGFGFISTIVSNYLIKHLNAKYIGYIFTKKLAPFVTIHQNKIVQPIEIFYDEKENIIIIQSSIGVDGIEYDIAEIILDFAKKIKADKIITIEGVTSMQTPTETVFFFTNSTKEEKKLLEKGLEKINEGIIVGVTGALLIKVRDFPLVSLFVEVHSEMPDNKASAKIIEVLDNYLNLKVDYRPLIKKAEEIEKKVKEIMEKIIKTKEESHKRKISYAG